MNVSLKILKTEKSKGTKRFKDLSKYFIESVENIFKIVNCFFLKKNN